MIKFFYVLQIGENYIALGSEIVTLITGICFSQKSYI